MQNSITVSYRIGDYFDPAILTFIRNDNSILLQKKTEISNL